MRSDRNITIPIRRRLRDVHVDMFQDHDVHERDERFRWNRELSKTVISNVRHVRRDDLRPGHALGMRAVCRPLSWIRSRSDGGDERITNDGKYKSH